jgi:hypothetical protein
MGTPELPKTYSQALEYVIRHVQKTLHESATHITTPLYVRRLIEPATSAPAVAKELFATALRAALAVPPHPPITITFGEHHTKMYDAEARRFAVEWANKGLVHNQRMKIISHFTTIGIRNDVAHNLAYLVMKTPEKVRAHAGIAPRNTAAGH